MPAGSIAQEVADLVSSIVLDSGITKADKCKLVAKALDLLPDDDGGDGGDFDDAPAPGRGRMPTPLPGLQGAVESVGWRALRGRGLARRLKGR